MPFWVPSGGTGSTTKKAVKRVVLYLSIVTGCPVRRIHRPRVRRHSSSSSLHAAGGGGAGGVAIAAVVPVRLHHARGQPQHPAGPGGHVLPHHQSRGLVRGVFGKKKTGSTTEDEDAPIQTGLHVAGRFDSCWLLAGGTASCRKRQVRMGACLMSTEAADGIGYAAITRTVVRSREVVVGKEGIHWRPHCNQ